MTSRKYELVLTKSQKWALYVPSVMFILMPIVFIGVFFSAPEMARIEEEAPPFFPWFPLGIFLIVGCLMLVPVMTMYKQVVVTSDNLITFKSRFRDISLRASDISSIEPSTMRWLQVPLTFYLLKHRDGKMRIPGQFTGLHQLLTELKRVNPGVELMGC